MRMAFFYDQTRCMGCSSCTVSCKDYYNVNAGAVSYRKQGIYEVDGSAGNFYTFVMSCNHCENPICAEVCDAGAISKREDGLVIIDRNKCVKLEACVSACPFAAPGIADDRQETPNQEGWQTDHPMQKCDMCAELMAQGQQPVCVRACPHRALEVGDFDELKKKHPDAVQLSPAAFPYAYINGTDETGPSYLIKPRKKMVISGDL